MLTCARLIAASIVGASLIALPSIAPANAETAASVEVEAAIWALPLPPPVDELIVFKEMRPKGRSSYIGMITREAETRGLPAAVADAVAQIESAYDPSAVGRVGEFGLMQVRASTAALLGHKGPGSELFVPETNIRYGVAYLAEAWRLAKGDLCRALMKYRAGHGEERMTARSVEYCIRARSHLADLGSPLAAAPVPPVAQAPTPVRPFDKPGPTQPTRASQSERAPVAHTASNPSIATPRPRTADVPTGGLSNRPAAEQARAGKPSPGQEVVQRLWAEHAARLRAIEGRIDRIMSGG